MPNERLKEIIIAFLKRRRGKENAITVADMADKIGMYDDVVTNPRTRQLIREIIDDLSLPIGSCQQGYYLISNLAEYEEYSQNLFSRAISIQTRRKNLRKAFVEMYGTMDQMDQMALPF